MTIETVDVESLVEAGLLSLDKVFSEADWENEFVGIAYYDYEGRKCDVTIQSATCFGITAFRWAESDEQGTYDVGEITLDREGAIAGAQGLADDRDDRPDVKDVCQQVIDLDWFPDTVTVDDLVGVCTEAAGHEQGNVLVPRATPTNTQWVTAGWLECDHVSLPATCEIPGQVALALLEAVRARVQIEAIVQALREQDGDA